MAIKQQYNQINLGIKQYLTLICLSLNEFQSPQSKISPRIYRVRIYIGPRESTRTIVNNLAVKYNVQQYCVTSRSFGNLPEKYQSIPQR